MPKKDKRLLELERSIERMQKENELTFSVMSKPRKKRYFPLLIIAALMCAISVSLLYSRWESVLLFASGCLVISGGVTGGIFKRKLTDICLTAVGLCIFIASIIISVEMIIENTFFSTAMCILFFISAFLMRAFVILRN